jgi:hypothetical protein
LAVHTIIECQPAWLDELRNSYATNKHALQWIQKLQLAPDAKGRFSVKDGLLYFRQHLWLGGSQDLQLKILQAFHASVTGGHSGFPATYAKLRRLFAWPKMKR